MVNNIKKQTIEKQNTNNYHRNKKGNLKPKHSSRYRLVTIVSFISITLTIVLFIIASSLYNRANNHSNTEMNTAINKCIALCQKQLQSNRNLSKGPCLSNNITPNWVCDVAHNPRAAVDNDPNNQCRSFRKGLAHHFVEVDTHCKLIRYY